MTSDSHTQSTDQEDSTTEAETIETLPESPDPPPEFLDEYKKGVYDYTPHLDDWTENGINRYAAIDYEFMAASERAAMNPDKARQAGLSWILKEEIRLLANGLRTGSLSEHQRELIRKKIQRFDEELQVAIQEAKNATTNTEAAKKKVQEAESLHSQIGQELDRITQQMDQNYQQVFTIWEQRDKVSGKIRQTLKASQPRIGLWLERRKHEQERKRLNRKAENISRHCDDLRAFRKQKYDERDLAWDQKRDLGDAYSDAKRLQMDAEMRVERLQMDAEMYQQAKLRLKDI